MLRRLISLFLLLGLPVFAGEVPLGEDGLHKPAWLVETFKDLNEDLEEANAEGKRLWVIWEQRGCIYCTKMHNEVFTRPEIKEYIEENFFVVQMNLFGDVEVTDFDGGTLSEREMALKWGIMFTPTSMYFPKEVEDGVTAPQAAALVMPGAYMGGTTMATLMYVKNEIYLTGQHLQHYVADYSNGLVFPD